MSIQIFSCIKRCVMSVDPMHTRHTMSLNFHCNYTQSWLYILSLSYLWLLASCYLIIFLQIGFTPPLDSNSVALFASILSLFCSPICSDCRVFEEVTMTTHHSSTFHVAVSSFRCTPFGLYTSFVYDIRLQVLTELISTVWCHAFWYCVVWLICALVQNYTASHSRIPSRL